MTEPLVTEVTEVMAERSCSCGHSATAHTFTSSGKCSFCSCQEVDLHVVQNEVLPAVVAPLSGLASDAGYILLREMAERLGLAAAQLRRAAAKRAVPAVKVGRRWAVRPEDIPVIEAHFSSRTQLQRTQTASSHDLAPATALQPAQAASSQDLAPATASEPRQAVSSDNVAAPRTASQRAQATSSHDMAAHLHHAGRVVSDPVVGEQPAVSPARQVETAAIDRQLDPATPEHRNVPLLDDAHHVAHEAEQGALEEILRPSPPPAPQRSI